MNFIEQDIYVFIDVIIIIQTGIYEAITIGLIGILRLSFQIFSFKIFQTIVSFNQSSSKNVDFFFYSRRNKSMLISSTEE
jgi:hypothetical protein